MNVKKTYKFKNTSFCHLIFEDVTTDQCDNFNEFCASTMTIFTHNSKVASAMLHLEAGSIPDYSKRAGKF